MWFLGKSREIAFYAKVKERLRHHLSLLPLPTWPELLYQIATQLVFLLQGPSVAIFVFWKPDAFFRCRSRECGKEGWPQNLLTPEKALLLFKITRPNPWAEKSQISIGLSGAVWARKDLLHLELSVTIARFLVAVSFHLTVSYVSLLEGLHCFDLFRCLSKHTV